MKSVQFKILLLIFLLTFAHTTQAQNNRDSLLNNINTLLNTNTNKAKEALLNESKKLISSNTEEDLVIAMNIYKELGEDVKYGELNQTILRKYPKGTTSRSQAANDFLNKIDQQTALWIEKQYINWLKNFPPSDYNASTFETYDMVLMQLINHYLSIGEYTLVDKYKNTFIGQSLKTISYYNIAENYLKQEKIADSKFHIDSALIWSDHARQSSDKKIKSSFGAMMYNNIALLSAQVELKNGNPAQAISLLPDILHNSNYQPMHSESMILTLAEAYKTINANLDAFIEMQNYAIHNEDVGKVWDEIHQLYIQINGNEGNFFHFKNNLENEKNNKNMQSLKENLIKKEVNDFELINLEGDTVKLSDYKGKIVILDFWATWCVPCVRSFPAMQQLINEYRDNVDIVFLFVNTWEKKINIKESVNDLIKSNNYSFNVLFDEISKRNNSLLATQLEVPSLPTKILIDRNGYMRIKISGSESSDQSIKNKINNLIKIGTELN